MAPAEYYVFDKIILLLIIHINLVLMEDIHTKSDDFSKNIISKAPLIMLSDGNMMPVVALGTGRGMARTINEGEVQRVVISAITAGYRHIDTSAAFGDEELVGRGIADAIKFGFVKRDDLFITTKLWNMKHHYGDVVPALEKSLTRLGLRYVDLFLIHWPVAMKSDGKPDDVDYLDTWKGMEAAKAGKMTRSIGVANFNAYQLARLLENSVMKPVVNQIEVSPTMTQEDLVDYCQKNKIVVMASSPFGYLNPRKKTDYMSISHSAPKLIKIAQKYGKATGQIILRYLIDRGLVVVPKSTNNVRIEQNIDLFDFHLTEDEIRLIGTFNRNRRVIEPLMWESFPHYPFV